MGLAGFGERICATDDFTNLLGDLGLPLAVCHQRQGLMRSSALSVADFIARCREASSDAADSSSAAYTR